MHFTQEPPNPSYFNNGSDANLMWDYTDPHNNIHAIIYSVVINRAFVKMLVNDSHGVQEHPDIPPSYKGRVKIEGRATLVIENINPGDIIPYLDVNSLELLTHLRVEFSLLWQVCITDININNQT